MKSMLKFVCIFLLTAAVGSPVLFAQDSTDESQKMWMEYMTPGKAHGLLAKSVGEWKTETKFWMAPGTEPMVSEGKAVNEMILGGRYLQAKHTGTAWGMPMEGIMITGYDNATNEFTSVWMDNLGTGISVSKGTIDASGNSINWKGTMVDPMAKKEIPVREVLTMENNNHQIFEIYMMHEGQEFKSMEIHLTR